MNFLIALSCLFTLQVNTTSDEKNIGFIAEVKVPVNQGEIIVDGIKSENALYLGGKISHKIGSTGATGSLYMRGIWYKAFGLKWLNFGNINLG